MGFTRDLPLKSTSPFPSVSKISMTRCTSGFCWSSGSDMNSSTLSEPELSRSSFLNLFPSLLISSASTETKQRDDYFHLHSLQVLRRSGSHAAVAVSESYRVHTSSLHLGHLGATTLTGFPASAGHVGGARWSEAERSCGSLSLRHVTCLSANL